MTDTTQPSADDNAQLTTAYVRYNAAYNNTTYLAVQTTFVREVRGAYQTHVLIVPE